MAEALIGQRQSAPLNAGVEEPPNPLYHKAMAQISPGPTVLYLIIVKRMKNVCKHSNGPTQRVCDPI
jgi:hypothetical protein